MLTWSCLSASIPLCQCRLIMVFLFVYFCFKQFIESYLSSYQQFSSSIDSFSLYTMAINQNRDIIACARGRKSVDTYPTSKNRKKNIQMKYLNGRGRKNLYLHRKQAYYLGFTKFLIGSREKSQKPVQRLRLNHMND